MNTKRILDNIEINNNGCWIWTKSVTSQGYGQLTEKGKYYSTHVYSYLAFGGSIPDGSIIRHLCHTRRCCNPDHLTTGTSAQNYEDSRPLHEKVARGRRKTWRVGDRVFYTFREAVAETGICSGTMNKFCVNGVFDIEAYREGCTVAKWIPKV